MSVHRKCPICGHEGNQVFENMILHKYTVAYYQCPHCRLLYTEEPYWLDEAYEEAIVGTDTGLMQRNISFCVLVNTLIRKFYASGKQFLDYGGGYGIFVRLMRDAGHPFKWIDKYSENLVAKGFEYEKGKIELLTAFELFEHFDRPRQEFENLLNYSHNILLSTTIYGRGEEFPQADWWYYAPHAGQHIAFYHEKTFVYLAQKYQLNYYQISDNLHLLTEKKLSDWKFRLLIKSRLGKVYQYAQWFLSKKNALCEEDSRRILEKAK